jgi:hypothetical protein
MNELAADREKCAARKDRGADSAERDAADSSLSPVHRRQAAAQAPISRRLAREYREEAAQLRSGIVPGEEY